MGLSKVVIRGPNHLVTTLIHEYFLLSTPYVVSLLGLLGTPLWFYTTFGFPLESHLNLFGMESWEL